MGFEPWDGWRRDVISGTVGAAVAAAVVGVGGMLHAQSIEDELTRVRAREYQAKQAASDANSDAAILAAEANRYAENAGRLRQQLTTGNVDTP